MFFKSLEIHGFKSFADKTVLNFDAQTTAARDLEDHGLALAATPARELTSEVARGVCGEGAPTTRWLSLASAGGPLADLVQGSTPELSRWYARGFEVDPWRTARELLAWRDELVQLARALD